MDVRSESAKEHQVNGDGRVTGVHVTVHEMASCRYEACNVHVLGEDRSGRRRLQRLGSLVACLWG